MTFSSRTPTYLKSSDNGNKVNRNGATFSDDSCSREFFDNSRRHPCDNRADTPDKERKIWNSLSNFRHRALTFGAFSTGLRLTTFFGFTVAVAVFGAGASTLSLVFAATSCFFSPVFDMTNECFVLFSLFHCRQLVRLEFHERLKSFFALYACLIVAGVSSKSLLSLSLSQILPNK